MEEAALEVVDEGALVVVEGALLVEEGALFCLHPRSKKAESLLLMVKVSTDRVENLRKLLLGSLMEFFCSI